MAVNPLGRPESRQATNGPIFAILGSGGTVRPRQRRAAWPAKTTRQLSEIIGAILFNHFDFTAPQMPGKPRRAFRN